MGGNILDGQIQFSRVPRDVGQQIHICKVFDPVLEVHMHSYVGLELETRATNFNCYLLMPDIKVLENVFLKLQIRDLFFCRNKNLKS